MSTETKNVGKRRKVYVPTCTELRLEPNGMEIGIERWKSGTAYVDHDAAWAAMVRKAGKLMENLAHEYGMDVNKYENQSDDEVLVGGGDMSRPFFERILLKLKCHKFMLSE